MQDEDEKPLPPGYTLGDDLSRLSVGDLEELAARLRAEADRVDEERERKKSAIGGAAALFRN